MRILLVHPFVRLGGAEKVVIEQCRELQKRGYLISILTSYVDIEHLDQDISDLDIIYPKEFINKLFVKCRILRQIFGAAIMLGQTLWHAKRADVLYAHNAPAHLFVILAKILYNKKIIWMCNEPPQKLPITKRNENGIIEQIASFVLDNSLERKIVHKYVDRILVLDELNKRRIAERYGRESYKVYTLSHSTNDCLQGIKVIKSDKIGRKPRFVIIGNLSEQKRVDLAIDLCGLLKNDGFNPKLHVIGDGPIWQELEERVKEKSLEDAVQFHGRILENKKKQLVQSSHFNLFCAENQSWGLTPIEALELGTLSIVSEKCGVAEVISKYECGYIFDGSLRHLHQTVLRAMYDYGSVFHLQKVKNSHSLFQEVLSVEPYMTRLQSHFDVVWCKDD